MVSTPTPVSVAVLLIEDVPDDQRGIAGQSDGPAESVIRLAVAGFQVGLLRPVGAAAGELEHGPRRLHAVVRTEQSPSTVLPALLSSGSGPLTCRCTCAAWPARRWRDFKTGTGLPPLPAVGCRLSHHCVPPGRASVPPPSRMKT